MLPNLRLHKPALKARCRSRRGATAVEFAFCAPVLLMIVFGVIEFGRIFMVQNALTNAAKDGCRKAILATTRDINQVTAAVKRQINIVAPNKNCSISCVPSTLQNISTGTSVTVTVGVNYSDVSWVPKSILPSGLKLQGKAVQIRE